MAIKSILWTYGLRSELNTERLIFCNRAETFRELPVSVRVMARRGLHYRNDSGMRLLNRFRAPTYYNILQYVVFSGNSLTPILRDDLGNICAAILDHKGAKFLLLGFDVENEVILYKQGDPKRTQEKIDRSGYGFSFERPTYLFSSHLHPRFPTIPWADNLCYLVLEFAPYCHPIETVPAVPFAKKGLIVITGDDDQAFIEKYDEQQVELRGLPITYFLVRQTKLKTESLSRFGEQVRFGIHPDSLDNPSNYAENFRQEFAFLSELTTQKLEIVRNHGYLNDGYWGHLPSWENANIGMSSNIPGVNGTCYTGSFIASKVRRVDGTWSNHYSILTAFGDGMMYACGISERKAVGKIRRLFRQIERSNPGVVVFNLHPQNVSSTKRIHRLIVDQSSCPGWKAVNMEDYLQWLRSNEC